MSLTRLSVRIAYLQTALKEQISLGRDHVSASDRPTNYYWYTSYGLMWSAVECSVRVCCLCALVLKPLLQKLRRGGSSVHSGGSKGVFSKRSAHSAGNGELGVPAGTAVEDAIFGSPKSPQMKLGGIQAMLEPSAEVPEEDTFDIMAFFAAGPGEPASPRIGTGALSTSPRMGFANGNAHGSGNGNGAEFGLGNSPSSSDSAMGAPLITLPTRISTHHFITAPVRWITKESEPPELAQAPTQRFFDVVQMGGRKPLTELTPREAWWPVMFGEYTRAGTAMSQPLVKVTTQRESALFLGCAKGRRLADYTDEARNTSAVKADVPPQCPFCSSFGALATVCLATSRHKSWRRSKWTLRRVRLHSRTHTGSDTLSAHSLLAPMFCPTMGSRRRS